MSTVEQVQARLDRLEDGKLNEPVTGVLVDLDLAELAIDIIRGVKAAGPDVQVIAFGAHVATDILAEALDAGADQVVFAEVKAAFAVLQLDAADPVQHIMQGVQQRGPVAALGRVGRAFQSQVGHGPRAYSPSSTAPSDALDALRANFDSTPRV